MAKPRSVHILTPCVVPHDAIGNDVIQMRSALLESGYAVRIYAEGIHPNYASIAEPVSSAPRAHWRSSEDILIYHHSVGWPQGEEIVHHSQNKIILRYHNITPAYFFAPYSVAHAQACEAGCESTNRLAKLRNVHFLGDSNYNCEELIELGANPDLCQVLAPLHLTEHLGGEQFDPSTLARYSGATVNILFVGGVKPNKGHARAIRVLAEYQRHFNNRARLIFAGGLDNRLSGYVSELRTLALQLGVADDVVFTGAMTGAQLKSLYVSADVFLCTSEHEGFCVPLIEAMYFRVPIVAWSVTAVAETLGEAAMALEDSNEFGLASHIAAIVDDPQLAEGLGTLGRRRYQEAYSPVVLRAKLDGIIAEVTQRTLNECVA